VYEPILNLYLGNGGAGSTGHGLFYGGHSAGLNGVGTAGLANTGSGGGASGNGNAGVLVSGAGASGIIIVSWYV
jgi:hypothetical protein